MNTKIIEYLNLRRKKLRLALEQIRFRDKAKQETKHTIKNRITARLEEIEGMIKRLEEFGIDKMIVDAKADYQKRKEKKDDAVREVSTKSKLKPQEEK